MPARAVWIRVLRLVAVVSWTVLAMYVGLWLVVACRFYLLSRTAQQTVGVVVALEANNHRTVRYRYAVAGSEYSGSDRSGHGGTPAFEALSVGAPVSVSYDPAKPEDSCLGDAGAVSADETRGAFLGAVWLGSFLGATLWWRWEQYQARRSANAGARTAPPN